MTTIEVGYAAVAQCSQEMATSSKGIEGRLHDLTDQLAKLDWDNDARAAYAQVEKDMKQAVAEMQRILGEISKAVQEAHDGYQQMEARGAAAWGG